jgi:hypothetical protein
MAVGNNISSFRRRVDAFTAALLGGLITLFFIDFFTEYPVRIEWETMLAGGFAVLAAFITIAQMRATDDKQDLRQIELRSLQLRDDGLRIWRAKEPSSADLASWAHEAEERWKRFSEAFEAAPDSTATLDYAETFLEKAKQLRGIVRTDTLKGAIPLFPPSLADNHSRLERYASTLLKKAEAAGEELPHYRERELDPGAEKEPIAMALARARISDGVWSMRNFVTPVFPDARSMSAGLEDLHKRYENATQFLR